MKSVIASIPLLGLSAVFSLLCHADPFEDGMREAFNDYKKGNNEAVTAKLRELLKIMDEKGAAKVGGLLPDAVDPWRGETVKKDEVPGGGFSLTRVYVAGERRITVKVIKDSPMVAQLLPLLGNEDLIRLSNRKTHRIAGETAIMDGEHKLQVVVDKRIYVELECDDETGEKQLVSLATKLDLNKLAKLK